jgi:hypothetical protein
MKIRVVLLTICLFNVSLAYADKDRLCLMRTCIKPEKMILDFDEIVNRIANFYGPLSFKEQKYNFTLSELAATTREALKKSTTDADAIGHIKKFLAKFHDAHISLYGGMLHEAVLTNKMIPIAVLPLDDKFFVLESELAAEGIQPGDEVISIDGKTPGELLVSINQYSNSGHDLANLRMNADHLFYRDYYLQDIYPQTDTATVRFLSKTSGLFDRTLVWRRVPGLQGQQVLQALKKKSPFSLGSPRSFFVSPHIQQVFAMKDESKIVEKAEKPEEMNEQIDAFLYRHSGKVILLVRQNTYTNDPAKYLPAYRELLREFRGIADVLVIDQTNNNGGSLNYAVDFFRLFSGKNSKNVVVKTNADLGWIQDSLLEYYQGRGSEGGERQALIVNQKLEELANDGTSEDKFMPLYMNNYLEGDAEVQWTKPVLVLINELAVSCGDIVPLLFKGNDRAKLFGTRTMGGGGSVEKVVSGQHSHTGLIFEMTRSLITLYREDGKYTVSELVENQGVSPDFPYVISEKDLNDGFVGYVTAFSDVAASLTVPRQESPPAT